MTLTIPLLENFQDSRFNESKMAQVKQLKHKIFNF